MSKDSKPTYKATTIRGNSIIFNWHNILQVLTIILILINISNETSSQNKHKDLIYQVNYEK